MMAGLSWANYVPLWLFCPVLIAVAFCDLKWMKIPNKLVIIGLVLFLATLPFLEFYEGLARVRDFAICFGLCLLLFAIGWLGGGDAKMLPVVFLFIPSAWATSYMFVFAASLLIGMVFMWGVRQVYESPKSDWVSLRPGAAFPMGISISLSGLFFAGWSVIS